MPKVTQKISKKQYRSPAAIVRRNEQERERVNATNSAFDDLRKVVPFGEWNGKKKSKVQTIEAAMQHIQNLMNILESSRLPSNGLETTTSYQMPPKTTHFQGENSVGFSSENSDFTDSAHPVIENLLTNIPAAENWSDIPVDYSIPYVMPPYFNTNYESHQNYNCPSYYY